MAAALLHRTPGPARELAMVAATMYEVLRLAARAVGTALIDSATGQRWPLPDLP